VIIVKVVEVINPNYLISLARVVGQQPSNLLEFDTLNILLKN